MAKLDKVPFNANHVNTEIAFKVWSLDIKDLERRLRKIQKLEGGEMSISNIISKINSPQWLWENTAFGERRTCKCCNKEFLVAVPGEYVYKRVIKGKTCFFCSWTCYRKEEKSLEKKRNYQSLKR